MKPSRMMAVAAATLVVGVAQAKTAIWTGTSGGVLNASSSSWYQSAMPVDGDTVCFRYVQSAPVYFDGTDPVNWSLTDYLFGDSVDLHFEGEVALGKGNSILATPTGNSQPLRYGSVMRLTSGTMGYTTDTVKEMIFGGDGRGTGTLILDGPDAKWQMGYAQPSRFGYGDTCNTLIVTNGATFVGPLVLGCANGSRYNLIHVSGKGSKYLVPTGYTKEMVIGGTSSGNEFRLSDGARYEQLTKSILKIGYSKTYGKAAESNNVMRLESGSRLYTAGSLILGHLSYGGGGNRLEITGGSKVVVGGDLTTAYNDETSATQRDTDTKLLVSGEGTELTVTNHFVVGYRYADNCQTIIESNAVVRPLNRFHLGSESYGSSNTTVLVRDGGVLNLSGSQEASRMLFVGWNPSSTDGALIIDKGGYLYKTNDAVRSIQINGGARNRIEVRNGGRMIMKNTEVSVGNGAATADASFVVRDGGYVRFDDSATTRSFIVGANAPRAHLVVDNAGLYATNLYLRTSHGGAGASNSVVQVVNGGHLVVKRVLLGNMGSHDAVFALTNGLVEVMADSFQAGVDGGVNNHVCIGGTNSFINVVNANFHAKQALTVDVDIPTAGASAAHPMILANKLVCEASTPIAMTVRVPERYYGPRTLTLLKTRLEDIDYSKLSITLVGAESAYRKKAEIIRDARELKVKIPRSFGMLITIW